MWIQPCPLDLCSAVRGYCLRRAQPSKWDTTTTTLQPTAKLMPHIHIRWTITKKLLVVQKLFYRLREDVSNGDGNRVSWSEEDTYYSYLYSPKSPFSKNFIVQSAVKPTEDPQCWRLYVNNDAGTAKYANKNVNTGFRNVTCKTASYE